MQERLRFLVQGVEITGTVIDIPEGLKIADMNKWLYQVFDKDELGKLKATHIVVKDTEERYRLIRKADIGAVWEVRIQPHSTTTQEQ